MSKKGITEKELRIAAKKLKLQFGLIDVIINEARKLRYERIRNSK